MKDDNTSMTNKQAVQQGYEFAFSKIESGIKENDAKQIGQGLHAIQDCSAHNGIANHEHVDYGNKRGNNRWESIKNTINDLGHPKDVIKAWKETYKALQEIKNNNNQEQPVVLH